MRKRDKQNREVVYTARCQVCSLMSFDDPTARDSWAFMHAASTGHSVRRDHHLKEDQ